MTTETRGEDWHEPQRDQKGRFRRGSTGNPDGRPRKRPPEPWSLSRSIATALSDEVAVIVDGKHKILQTRDIIVQSFVRALPKAKPREALQMLERLNLMGALEPIQEQPSDCLTEEDRLVMEIIARKYLPRCPDCQKPLDHHSPE